MMTHLYDQDQPTTELLLVRACLQADHFHREQLDAIRVSSHAALELAFPVLGCIACLRRKLPDDLDDRPGLATVGRMNKHARSSRHIEA
jgi:hypothetical protein